MYRVGVIGCGMIAELGHLPAIEQVPGIELYALFDLDFGRAKQLQRRFGVPHAYPTEEDFYGSNIDAVVVCTPAHVHHRNVLDAARAGKHVLCEKPLGVTEEEMLEMDEVMRGAGLQLFTGFNYRFSQSAVHIRRLVREHGIGEVRLLRLIYNWHLHGKWHWDEDGRRVDAPLRVGRMREGGPMVDCGVHQIDLARWWLDSEVRWQRGLGVWIDDYEAPDQLPLRAHRHRWRHPLQPGGALLRDAELLRYPPPPLASGEELRRDLPELVRALDTGAPGDMPTAHDGLMASRIAWAATNQAIRDRDQPSRACPSTRCRAEDVDVLPDDTPLDGMDLPVDPELIPA
jgi:hypothetical protein